MAESTIHRYGQTKALLDKALELGTLRAGPMSKVDAGKLQRRLHSVMSKDRQHSRKVFEPGDPEYGTSPYDQLSVLTEEVQGASPPAFNLVITKDNITALGYTITGPDGKEIDL